jgi:hypothetical protein
MVIQSVGARGWPNAIRQLTTITITTTIEITITITITSRQIIFGNS